MKLGDFIILILGIGIWIFGLINFINNVNNNNGSEFANGTVAVWFVLTIGFSIYLIVNKLPLAIKWLNKFKVW